MLAPLYTPYGFPIALWTPMLLLLSLSVKHSLPHCLLTKAPLRLPNLFLHCCGKSITDYNLSQNGMNALELDVKFHAVTLRGS